MTAQPCVLWDFDGTLASRDGLWAGAVHKAAADLGLETGGIDAIRAGLSSGFPWHDAERGHERVRTADDWWQGLYPVLRAAAVAAGIPEYASFDVATAARRSYLDPSAWTVYPDAVPALELAARLGWSNAILSNHVPELPDLVEALGLAPHFDAVLSSAQLGWEKPNPRIFEAALERLGRPEVAWMIGDSREADYDGARAAGLPAILIARTQGPRDDPLLAAVHRIGAPATA